MLVCVVCVVYVVCVVCVVFVVSLWSWISVSLLKQSQKN